MLNSSGDKFSYTMSNFVIIHILEVKSTVSYTGRHIEFHEYSVVAVMNYNCKH